MKRIILAVALIFTSGYSFAQKAYTLEECRQLAIENNKELKISSKKIEIANDEKKAALTKYFPQLSAMGGYIWNQKDINLLDMGAMTSTIGSALGPLAQLPIVGQIMEGVNDLQHLDIQNVWVGGVTLVQPVFMGGKIVNYNQITEYARQLALSMNNLQLQDVIYKTDETYWQVISLVNKKKLADAYVNLLQKTDKDISAMIEEGVATEADGLSVKVKLNEAEMAQTKVNNGLALTKMLLSQICGLPIEEPLILSDETIDNYHIAISEKTSADINEAFSNRDELKSLDFATQIYKRKEKLVLADMLPNVALTANYLITNPNAHNGFKNEFAGGFHVGVMMKIPMSGWWEGTFKRNSARAETQIKKLEFDNAREKIELQVNQSVYKVNEANKKLISSTRNMENADENLRHASLGFEEGVIPALNLMQAQTAWVSAKSNLIDAQIEVKLSEVYLTKAMGKLTNEKE